jgi:acyl carrier protein
MDQIAAMEQIVIVVQKAVTLPAAVTPHTRLLEDLGLDSTGLLELLMDLEEAVGFQVDVDELEPEAFQTVGSLAGYVAKMTGAA